MSTESERHARLKALFLRALELDEKDRSRFVYDACKAEPELRAELESLLAHHLPSDLEE